MAEKGRSTQSIVNSFPDWSNIRQDEQSLGYQFVNSVGQLFDDLNKQLVKVTDNQYLSTSVISDIDLYYRVKLDDSFEFTKDDDDDTDFIFTPPSVSGVVGDSNYVVSIAEDNNIETFWYTPVPDRLSLSTTVSRDHFIASGFISRSPFTQDTCESGLHITNHVTVSIDNGTSFIGVDNGIVRKGIVQIYGKNREGVSISEEMIFVHNETQKTYHEFSEINSSGIRVYGINDPNSATINVTSAAFNQEDYPVQYELSTTVDKEDQPMFWSLGSGEQVGIKTLDLSVYDIDDLELRIDGFTSKHVILQQELLNEAGSNITPTDLAEEPHSNRIWITDENNLYVYSNALPYPDLTVLEGKDYDADSVIELDTYYTIIGNEVEINYTWRRPVQGIVSHRVWVLRPDGTKKSLEDGVEINYYTDSTSWIFGEPLSRRIRPSHSYTFNQRGDYIFYLEVRYTDDTKSIDKRVVSVFSRQPEAQFSLAPLGITTAQGVDFDSEYNLWVVDVSGVKYKINRHYDRMMIDFSRKIIYFREPYTQVRIF